MRPVSLEQRSADRVARVRSLPATLGLFGALLTLSMLLSSCTTARAATPTLRGTLHITGSSALEPFTSQAGKRFERLHPEVRVTVEATGSLNGIDDVTGSNVNGKNTKREVRADIGESDVYADPSKYPNPDITDELICVEPFTMIVNPDVTITSLTRQQIIDVYSGATTNWKQVGGPDLRVTAVVRPPTSGTRATFRKYVLGGRDENGTVLQSDVSKTVLDTVAQTPGAIGYLVLSLVDPSVRAIAIDGKTPTRASIESGSYPFWSYGHMITLGTPSDVVQAFLDFMLTPDVQQLAVALNYIPIADTKKADHISPFAVLYSTKGVRRESF